MQHRTIAAALAAVAVLALAGCGSDDKPAKPAAPVAAQPDAAAEEDQPPAGVKVGQAVTIKQDDKAIDMAAVQFVDPAKAGPLTRAPEPGMRLVAVQWKFTASGAVAVDAYPAMTSQVYDADGQSYSADHARKTASGPSYPEGANIPPGSTTTGWVVYELPAAAKVARIQYSPGLGLAANTGTWTL